MARPAIAGRRFLPRSGWSVIARSGPVTAERLVPPPIALITIRVTRLVDPARHHASQPASVTGAKKQARLFGNFRSRATSGLHRLADRRNINR
jgi:hypothetical protein